MGTTADKLTYLNTTKGKIKHSINLTGANIGSNDTFRSYAVKLRDGLVNVLNNGTIILYNNFPKVSGTGSNISLTNTLEAPMFMNKFDGDTLQNGTPTPSTPIEIQSVEGIQNVEISDGTNANNYEINLEGKNLLINNATSQILNGVSFIKNSDGSISVNGTSTATVFYPIISDNEFPLITKNMILNGCPAGGSTSSYELRITYTDNTNVRDIGEGANLNNKTIKNVIIRLQANTTFNNLVFKPMIRYSSISDSDYVPYRSPIKLYNGDYITGTPYNWSIVRNNGSVILNGSESYPSMEWTGGKYAYRTSINNLKQITSADEMANVLTNYYKPYSFNGLYNSTEKYGVCNRLNQSEIIIRNDDCTTSGSLQTWLSTHNTEVVYKLATPTTEQITDTYLISQLNALYNAKSYNGQTNISVSGNLPTILDVSALKDEI